MEAEGSKYTESRNLAALATGSEKWFGRLWTRAVSCQLSAPAELQGQKATQNHCDDVIRTSRPGVLRTLMETL